MAFINSMRDRLTQAGQSTVQKAKDLSEVAKLNSMISGAEKQINELYGKIGYEVCCAYSNAPLPEVAELIQQVTDLLQTIEACKAKIVAINLADLCPQCGAKINKGMAFCSGCGHKLAVEETTTVERASFCSNCGAQISADSLFCTSCGNKIG